MQERQLLQMHGRESQDRVSKLSVEAWVGQWAMVEQTVGQRVQVTIVSNTGAAHSNFPTVQFKDLVPKIKGVMGLAVMGTSCS